MYGAAGLKRIEFKYDFNSEFFFFKKRKAVICDHILTAFRKRNFIKNETP